MSPIRTCSPIAKRTTETFVDHVNIGGERQRVEFQREVIPPRQDSCRVS